MAIRALLPLALAACSAGPSARIEDAFASGDYEHATTLLAADPRGLDGSVRLLDHGVAALMSEDFDRSRGSLREAAGLMEGSQPISVTENFASTLADDRVKAFGGVDHDHVLVHFYQSLAYLLAGDTENALVKGRASFEALKVVRQRHGEAPTYDIPAVPYYLSSLMGATGGDANMGVFYRQAQKSLEGVELAEPQVWNGPTAIVVVLKGRAPLVESRPEPVTDVALEIVEKYNKGVRSSAPVPVPVLVPRPSGLGPVTVARGSEEGYRVPPVYDVFQGLELAYRDAMPWIMARAVIRRVAKRKIADEVGKKNKDDEEDDEAQKRRGGEYNFAAELTNLVLTAVESADTRSWTFLPETIHVFPLPVEPGANTIEIGFGQTSVRARVWAPKRGAVGVVVSAPTPQGIRVIAQRPPAEPVE